MSDLLSVAPATMDEDEKTIGRGYKKQSGVIVAAIVLGATAHYLDIRYLVAVGFMIVIGAISFAEARLYDLCIRLKRSNHLQYDGRPVELLGIVKQMDTRLFHIMNALDLETKSNQVTAKRSQELQDRLKSLLEATKAPMSD